MSVGFIPSRMCDWILWCKNTEADKKHASAVLSAAWEGNQVAPPMETLHYVKSFKWWWLKFYEIVVDILLGIVL